MHTRGPGSDHPMGLSGWTSDEPPLLENFSAEPKYDLKTVVALVQIRPLILLSWEQQLGIVAPPRPEDDASGSGRRYSERDLVSLLWLREQIVKGKSPADAAALLRARQPHNTFYPTPTPSPRSPNVTRKLDDVFPGDLPAGRMSAPDLPSPPSKAPYHGAGAASSPTLGSATSGPLRAGMSGPLVGGYTGLPSAPAPGQDPWQGVPSYPAGRTSAPSLPLRAAMHSIPDLSRMSNPNLAPGDPIGSGPASVPAPELRSLLPQLVRAFTTFETAMANRVLEIALSSRSFETTCLHLLQPALNRVSELYAHGNQVSLEERFAQQYARAFLSYVFHKTPEHPDAPLAIVGCAPREYNEIAALTLAAFWRRQDLRVLYLGPNMDGDLLIEEARRHRPTVVSLAITSSQRVRTLSRIGKQFTQLEGRRPIFAYWGAVFARHPELQKKVQGVFLGDDPWQATWHLKRMLGPHQAASQLRSAATSYTRFSQPTLRG